VTLTCSTPWLPTIMDHMECEPNAERMHEKRNTRRWRCRPKLEQKRRIVKIVR